MAQSGPGQAAVGTSGVPSPTTETPFSPNAPATTSADQASAESIFESTLQSYGFDSADVASLMTWATGQITGSSSPDKIPVPESQVALNLMQTPQFAARFPGIIAQQKAQKSNPGQPVMSPGDYVSYETYAMQTAKAAGLPDGLLTPQVIGELVAGNVSTQELSDRITKGYQDVAETTPEVRQYMAQAFGVGPNDLAAFFLNPDAATPLLFQKATAAQIGGAGEAVGFGEISPSITLKAAQMGETAAQGTQALQGETAQQLALTKGLLSEKATGGPGTVSENTLASAALIGDQSSVRAVKLAGETRAAALGGGGGYGQTERGVAAGTVGEVGAANQGRG